MQRNEIIDIDGRSTTFWTLTRERYHYNFQQGKTMIQANFYPMKGLVKYYQYYSNNPPVISERMLSSSTSTTSTVKKEEEENGPIFFFLYVLSQLGGLYTFLIGILGFIMYPITRQLFIRDCISDLNKLREDQMLKAGVSDFQPSNNALKMTLLETILYVF